MKDFLATHKLGGRSFSIHCLSRCSKKFGSQYALADSEENQADSEVQPLADLRRETANLDGAIGRLETGSSSKSKRTIRLI